MLIRCASLLLAVLLILYQAIDNEPLSKPGPSSSSNPLLQLKIGIDRLLWSLKMFYSSGHAHMHDGGLEIGGMVILRERAIHAVR